MREIERALLDGEIDLAIHSAKDLPAELPDGLALAGVAAREDPADAWIGPGGSVAEIPAGARVGTASVRHEGGDVTVLAWLLMLHESMAAATAVAASGISTEVIDVRSLSPVDWKTIGESVRKTGRVIIVEEGPRTGGVGAELAAGIMERFPDSLLAPVIRVASADVPVPFSPVLENLYRPDRDRIADAIRQITA